LSRTQLLGIVILMASVSLLVYVAISSQRRRRGLREFDVDAMASGERDAATQGALRRWLAKAGYRQSAAPLLFVASVIAAAAVAWVVAWQLVAPVAAELALTVSDIPGGVGGLLAATVMTAPWAMFLILALIPVLVVRAARRQRVREVEEDLPLALELLATLAEAGLSFDAALSRILAQGKKRTLVREFMTFQRDVLAGVPRLQALRQLAHRVDVMSLTTFVSAIVQAEQMGASIAETLRHQADDLRDRRRERALLLAQALPVKLVFPLITCFLPSIFISTLGPVLFQMIQVANSVLRAGGR
jgi:tight adherence protein C